MQFHLVYRPCRKPNSPFCLLPTVYDNQIDAYHAVAWLNMQDRMTNWDYGILFMTTEVASETDPVDR